MCRIFTQFPLIKYQKICLRLLLFLMNCQVRKEIKKAVKCSKSIGIIF